MPSLPPRPHWAPNSPLTCRDSRAADGASRRLLTAHARLAIRPERNPRELSKRLRQAAVLVSWLVEQAATVAGVRRRAAGRGLPPAGRVRVAAPSARHAAPGGDRGREV